jgi:hypothetical protein
VTREQLVQALERQRLTGERLGEALVGQGVISKFELAGSLAEQASLADTPAEPEGEPAPVVQLAPRVDTPFEPEAVEPAAVEPEPESKPTRPREPRPAVELILESVSGRPDIEPELEPNDEAGLAALYEVPSEPAPEIEYVPEVALVPPYEASAEPMQVPEIEREPALAEFEPAGAEPEVERVARHEQAPTPATGLCVAFASTPRGYRLVELEDGLVPDVGERVELPEVGELVVLRRGASPLPADDRLCVFLEPLVPATA